MKHSRPFERKRTISRYAPASRSSLRSVELVGERQVVGERLAACVLESLCEVAGVEDHSVVAVLGAHARVELVEDVVEPLEECRCSAAVVGLADL